MKKIILLTALAIVGVSGANAQSSKTPAPKTTSQIATKVIPAKVDGPGIVFNEQTIDYGVIEQHSDGAREFKFTNNGNKILLISNVVGSCGCTVPSKPKEPIMPGESSVIGVKYATDRLGVFSKTVTVTSNVSGDPIVLTIKGNVVESATNKS